MDIQKFKKLLQDNGFPPVNIQECIKTINYIGVAQDIAWREGEGVLQGDIDLDNELLDFLIEKTIIIPGNSLYQNYPIYHLSSQYQDLFSKINNQIDGNKYEEVRSDLEDLDLSVLALIHSRDLYLKQMKDLSISDFNFESQVDYSILQQNSEYGEDLYLYFSEILSRFIEIMENHGIYYEITQFQSNRRQYHKDKFIGNQKVIKKLEQNYDIFYAKWANIIKNLNSEIKSVKRKLLNQQETRKTFLYQEDQNLDSLQSMINELSNRGYIKLLKKENNFLEISILDDITYNSEISKYIQGRIDSVTTPIIQQLLHKMKKDTTVPLEIDFSSIPSEKKVVFISYAQIDETIYPIQKIANTLKYFDDISEVFLWETHAKDDILDYMVEYVQRCDALLLFCSPNATSSKGVNLELKMALKAGKRIIPIFFREADIPLFLPYDMGIQYYPFNFQINIDKLHSLIVPTL
ncbi:MAG: toll/interleukin-1 receptor domain-containing protein [Promethearchaeota archaeon]